jgi:hypothetical protein
MMLRTIVFMGYGDGSKPINISHMLVGVGICMVGPSNDGEAHITPIMTV